MEIIHEDAEFRIHAQNLLVKLNDCLESFMDENKIPPEKQDTLQINTFFIFITGNLMANDEGNCEYLAANLDSVRRQFEQLKELAIRNHKINFHTKNNKDSCH